MTRHAAPAAYRTSVASAAHRADGLRTRALRTRELRTRELRTRELRTRKEGRGTDDEPMAPFPA